MAVFRLRPEELARSPVSLAVTSTSSSWYTHRRTANAKADCAEICPVPADEQRSRRGRDRPRLFARLDTLVRLPLLHDKSIDTPARARQIGEPRGVRLSRSALADLLVNEAADGTSAGPIERKILSDVGTIAMKTTIAPVPSATAPVLHADETTGRAAGAPNSPSSLLPQHRHQMGQRQIPGTRRTLHHRPWLPPALAPAE